MWGKIPSSIELSSVESRELGKLVLAVVVGDVKVLLIESP
jgi:hypothetical protein